KAVAKANDRGSNVDSPEKTPWGIFSWLLPAQFGVLPRCEEYTHFKRTRRHSRDVHVGFLPDKLIGRSLRFLPGPPTFH
ncbi:MAG: hypothetical protein JW709_02695, partial [Sedimentisphaerales bacterium]|nr:hypothetical protein [Sedimentisphaerales bacterium]